MSMRVERSSLDQVKKRFEVNKKKMEEKQKEYDFEERMKELREEVRRRGGDTHCWTGQCSVVFLMVCSVLSGGEGQGVQEGETEGEEAASGGGRGLGGG